MSRTIARHSRRLGLLSPKNSITGNLCLRCSARILATSTPLSELPATSNIQNQARRPITTSRPHHKESIRPETYYEYFPETLTQGPPPQGPFNIDIKALRKEFLRLQASTHPDRQPPDLKTRAEALSARVNEAFKTLSDPLLRAQYLLSLRGINVAEDETAKLDDQTLLMEVMESQEEIENATEEEQLRPLQETNEERIRETVDKLEKAFEEEAIETAKNEAVRLRYWVNIRDSLKDWEPGKPITLVH